ncbi:MAG: hypothetical protein LKM35_04605 [Lachnospiraceae bacterium]|jgi:hypothetical protein|nr:hypothetical protein [Lachnospiraceae bacterium]MCI1726951.1 hypothetical protein [Lachnospiraceae bacterium]
MKKQTLFSFIFLAAAIVIVTILLTTRTVTPLDFEVKENGFALTGPEKTSCEINYSDITSLDYSNQADFGSPTDGGTSLNCRYGTWENAAWGNYRNYTSTKINSCIICRTEDMTVVFNYENDDTTESIYKEIQKYCK